MNITIQKIDFAHRDNRREIKVVFNGEFTAKQLKILNINKGSVLGKHYHEYSECFYMLKGYAQYKFIDIDTKEMRLVNIKRGDRIIIGPRIAHMATFKTESIMVESTESIYIDGPNNDRSYDFD